MRFAAWVMVILGSLGCDSSQDAPAGPMATGTPSDSHESTSERRPVGGGVAEQGRRVRRLTADQFHASLTVATGQAWPDFERHAELLGRPDYAETLEEGVVLSAAFRKFVEDAARQACHAAVERDRSQTKATNRVVLRHATLDETREEAWVRNLEYLVRRFHGHTAKGAGDYRIAPWLRVIEAKMEEDTPEEARAEAMAARWEAVCIGLVVHPDFLTY